MRSSRPIAALVVLAALAAAGPAWGKTAGSLDPDFNGTGYRLDQLDLGPAPRFSFYEALAAPQGIAPRGFAATSDADGRRVDDGGEPHDDAQVDEPPHPIGGGGGAQPDALAQLMHVPGSVPVPPPPVHVACAVAGFTNGPLYICQMPERMVVVAPLFALISAPVPTTVLSKRT